MGQRLGRGRRRRDVDKRIAPSARRRAVSQRLQLGQRSGKGSKSERSVCQPVPEKSTQQHGEEGTGVLLIQYGQESPVLELMGDNSLRSILQTTFIAFAGFNKKKNQPSCYWY